MTEREFLEVVRRGRLLGYGRMMQIVSQEWWRQDPIGALTPNGPCYGQLTKASQASHARAIAADPLSTS